MADEPLEAAGAGGLGFGRRKTDREPERDPDPELGRSQFRTELIREVNKRDREIMRELTAQMSAQHAALMDAITAVRTEQIAHAEWIKAREAEQAEEERQRNEQALRAQILKDLQDKEAAARLAWHDRWSKYVGGSLVTLVGTLVGVLVYAGENTRALRWDVHSQWLAAGVCALVLLIVLIVRYGPI